MALKVIGAGLGRTGTLSLKLALEHIGFDRCYHMSEMLANMRSHLPLWIESAKGNPQWDTIFAGYQSTTDYPACTFWRELAEYYPDAKVILTVRDPDSWFESVTETIFSEAMQGEFEGTVVGEAMNGAIFAPFGGGDITDRAFMTDWFVKRNQAVIDALPPERLLVFHPKEGWGPLCDFLGVPVPPEPFPRVNSRDELQAKSDQDGWDPSDADGLERNARAYIEQLEAKAFGG